MTKIPLIISGIVFLSIIPFVSAGYEDAIVVLETNSGNLVFEFFPDDAPKHVENFIKLTKESQPPNSLTGIHLALWYAYKDNWDMSHSIVQDINTRTASWIHAYLHRVEGDLGNANYWYNHAGKKSSTESLGLELNKIIKSVLEC